MPEDENVRVWLTRPMISDSEEFRVGDGAREVPATVGGGHKRGGRTVFIIRFQTDEFPPDDMVVLRSAVDYADPAERVSLLRRARNSRATPTQRSSLILSRAN